LSGSVRSGPGVAEAAAGSTLTRTMMAGDVC
jgi:hypothetical protein